MFVLIIIIKPIFDIYRHPIPLLHSTGGARSIVICMYNLSCMHLLAKDVAN